MKMNRHSGLALLLIFFGALILLNKFGFHTGHVASFLFPVALIGFGWLGLKNGKSFIGIVLMASGGWGVMGTGVGGGAGDFGSRGQPPGGKDTMPREGVAFLEPGHHNTRGGPGEE